MHALTQFTRCKTHPFDQRDTAEKTSDVTLAPLRFIFGQKVNFDNKKVYTAKLHERIITGLVCTILLPLILVFTLVGTISYLFSKTHPAKCLTYFKSDLN